MSQALATRD